MRSLLVVFLVLTLSACDPGIDWVVVNPCDHQIQVVYWLESDPPDPMLDHAETFVVPAREEKTLGDLLGHFLVTIPELDFQQRYKADNVWDGFRVEPAAASCRT